MKMLTFAAGLAAGYVLGTRAGRERFDQLVRSARKMGNHPTVVQAQDKVKDVLSGDTRREQHPGSATMPAATATGRAKSSTARPAPTSNAGVAGVVAPSGVSKPLAQ